MTDSDGTAESSSRAVQYAPQVPSKHLPPMPYKDIPEALPLRKVLGPSVILAGVGVGSGAYIIWPYISVNVGLGFLWLAVIGLTMQYVLNMEIIRYTLATGETAVAGFARFWKPWALIFCVFMIVPMIWPGWGTAGATVLSYVFGGNPTYISVIVLLAIGVALTTSPVVYKTLEKAEFFKVGLTIVFVAIGAVAAIRASAWGGLADNFSQFGRIPSDEIGLSIVLAGLVTVGAGGASNLVQGNWVRDKGLGMGSYIPKIVSPLTGQPEAIPATGSMIRPDKENVARFKRWFKVVNTEQLVSFWTICLLAAVFFSVLAYSTLGGGGVTAAADMGFIKMQGEALKDIVGPWFGTFFWLFGALSLMLAAMGVIDFVSRLTADAVKTVHLTKSKRWSESWLYVLVVWAMVGIGSLILLSGLDQPLTLLVLAACLNGIVMFIYSGLLIHLNRKALPAGVRLSGLRLGAMCFVTLFYGVFAVAILSVQFGNL